MRVPPLVVSFLCLSVLTLSAQAPALKIVVLEGESGVNIIQQKTAVRPLVEVRDRNNLPVAGASVTFTIGGGGQSAAFAGGVQTLTVTTNAAGQAAAGGLNALSSGAFQIQVQAAYQGQIATAAISQTNFATAAAAAQAGASSTGAGSGAAGGTAGGGGGISATTIGIVGAAVGGGALAATKVAGGGEDRGIPTFTGPVSGQLVFTNVGPVSTCVSTRSVTGTLKVEVFGNGEGHFFLEATQTEISVSGPSCIPNSQPSLLNASGSISGAPAAITGSNTGSASPGALNQNTGFKGSVSGNTITGTLTIELSQQSTNTLNGVTSTFNGSGTTIIAVTLQR